MQQMITTLLQGLNHQVTVENNGIEALASLQQHDFDLILMDIRMPKMDGMQASARIRK